eukprot:gene10776-biopygen6312
MHTLHALSMKTPREQWHPRAGKADGAGLFQRPFRHQTTHSRKRITPTDDASWHPAAQRTRPQVRAFVCLLKVLFPQGVRLSPPGRPGGLVTVLGEDRRGAREERGARVCARAGAEPGTGWGRGARTSQEEGGGAGPGATPLKSHREKYFEKTNKCTDLRPSPLGCGMPACIVRRSDSFARMCSLVPERPLEQTGAIGFPGSRMPLLAWRLHGKCM